MGSEVGTEWRVETVVSVTDGDTVRLRRSRVIELDGRTYRITDEDPRGVAVRLTWVDTPERGDAGYKQAHDELANWVRMRSAAYPAPASYAAKSTDDSSNSSASSSTRAITARSAATSARMSVRY